MKKLKKLIFVTAAFSAVVFITGCKKFIDLGHHDNSDAVSVTDENFIAKTAIKNVAEIEAGTLAESKGTDLSVRNFGTMMVDDHSSAQAELKAIGSAIHRSVADTVDNEHKAVKEQLMSLAGKGV